MRAAPSSSVSTDFDSSCSGITRPSPTFLYIPPFVSYIHHLETLVPNANHAQADLCELMLARTNDPRTRRIIRKAYAESGIDRRHSVLTDFQQDSASPRLYRHTDGSIRKTSTTGERNIVYIEEAKRLIPQIATNALRHCKGISANEITHVITVSCTGFFNPGPDLLVIDALGLSPGVQRYHIGFMGCYAAFPALRMADQFCRADPAAVVLIVCIEFCTIHMQDRDDMDAVVANSVFSDGLAAAVVAARKPASGARGFEINHFASALATEGANDMAWDIGDTGFNIILSKYVSRIIGSGIRGIIDDAFAKSPMKPDDIAQWAVHPGGRAILDKVESSLGLDPQQIEASRQTLARFGNMSSATILFVLEAILADPRTRNGDAVCAMAFGPGLTIETSILHAATC